MANFYDVNAAIDKPNVLGAMQQGLQFGQQQRALREQRADQQQLRTLAPQVQQGDPSAFMQAAAIDPQAAQAQMGAGDAVARRAEGLVRLLEEADARDPREAQALWQAHGVPFARQFSQGTEPTTDWAQAKPMLANLKARIEMAKAAQGSQRPDVKVVGNALVDASGRELYRAPESERYFQTDQGLVRIGADGPEEVRLGGAASAMQAREQQITATANSMIRAGIPEAQVEAWMQQQHSLPMEIGSDEGARLLPASSLADRERLEIARNADRRAEEANARAAEAAERAARGNAPAGFRFKADGSLEPIPGGPKPAGAAATEGERKAATLLKRLEGSLSQLETAVRESPEAASPSLGAEIGRSLPFIGETAANIINTPERQRVESAQLDMLDAALTLGTGAAYTREQLQGYRRAYFPQVGDSKAAIRDKAARLNNVIEAARIAAGRASGGVSDPAQQSRGPRPGDIEDGYRFRGGDPSNPNSWEQVR